MKDFIIDLLIILIILSITYVNIEKVKNENFTDADINVSSEDGFDPNNVQTITFLKDSYTTGRRSNPIPQLNCVGGNACNYSSVVQSVQCQNVGMNESNNPQWKCSTSLPNTLSLGSTNVSCEGLRNSNDKLKLKGSCGLEYTLNTSYIYSDNSTVDFWVWCLILFVCVFLLYSIILIPRGGVGYYGSPYYSPFYFGPQFIPYYAPSYYGNYGRSSSYSPSFETSTGFGTTTTR